MSDHSAHESIDAFKRHIYGYIGVFVALLALTVLTVWASTWVVSVPAAAVVIALAIAGIKGGLVMSFFMHLKSEKPLVLYCLLLTAVFFLVVMLLPLFTLLQSITGNAG